MHKKAGRTRRRRRRRGEEGARRGWARLAHGPIAHRRPRRASHWGAGRRRRMEGHLWAAGGLPAG
eukprot:8336630-Pyramimonas_sp.AAC.1